ncbi:IS5 family transposase [Paraburkholderia youngii]
MAGKRMSTPTPGIGVPRVKPDEGLSSRMSRHNQGIEKHCEAHAARWHVAMRPGKRRMLNRGDPLDAIYDEIERLKAGIRAKVEHPFRVIKRQFGYAKTRYRGLMKNTAQMTTLFALSNLWMARRVLRKS